MGLYCSGLSVRIHITVNMVVLVYLKINRVMKMVSCLKCQNLFSVDSFKDKIIQKVMHNISLKTISLKLQFIATFHQSNNLLNVKADQITKGSTICPIYHMPF